MNKKLLSIHIHCLTYRNFHSSFQRTNNKPILNNFIQIKYVNPKLSYGIEFLRLLY